MLKKIILNNIIQGVNSKLYEENIISSYLYNFCKNNLSKKGHYNE